MKLWKNGIFYTMEDNNLIVNKVVTNNGIIVAIGDECNDYKNVDEIDLGSNFVFPGFHDAHMHLIGYGRKITSNNLSLCRNKDKVIRMIKEYYKNDTLYVEGYFNIGVTKDDLDLISADNIIILRHNDYHSFTVNSYVLKLLNLKHDTGILFEKEAEKILLLWSKYSKEQFTKMTELAIKSLHQNGITSVHTDDLSYFNSYKETIEILNEVTLNYPLRVNMLIHNKILDEHLNNQNEYNENIKSIQVKYFYDGTLSSKTALLNENYLNIDSNGQRMISKEKLLKEIQKLRSKELSIAIHTIGDLALNEVVSVIKENQSKNMPDRIVHASLADLKTILEMKKINIALDIQPLFIKSDLPWINKIINHKPLIYPFKEYNDNGILLNASSDAPVEDVSPLLGLLYLKDLTRFDALKTYTKNPALTINDNSGVIRKGYKADFTIFNQDLMTINNNELTKTKVLMTVINEKIVYLDKNNL